MPFELRVALRYLTARRKQAFISVISGISILGVAVGVMAVLIALALMTGLQTEVQSRILGATAHMTLFPSRSDYIDDYREVVRRLRAVPHVLGSAPAIYGKGVVSSHTGQQLATLKGIVPADERTVTDLATQTDPAALEAFERETPGLAPVLLGRDMAEALGVGAGDVVSVTVPQGRLSPMGVLPRVARFRVAGVVTSGLYEFDSSWAYVPLSVAQRLLEAGDRASLIEVRVDDMYAVKSIEPSVRAALGDGFLTQDWIDMNRRLFSALWLEKTAIAITIGLIVMVAALNIVATLILMVMEKHKDIAILSAMGASRRAIARIFMLQGSIIGACGTLAGAILGWGACRILDHYRLIRVPQDVYQIAYVPFTLLPRDALVVIVAALLTCFVATLYPARGAARLDPAQALRYE
jgi:lipoprotein-releasing system permease protein